MHKLQRELKKAKERSKLRQKYGDIDFDDLEFEFQKKIRAFFSNLKKKAKESYVTMDKKADVVEDILQDIVYSFLNIFIERYVLLKTFIKSRSGYLFRRVLGIQSFISKPLRYHRDMVKLDLLRIKRSAERAIAGKVKVYFWVI